MSTIIESIKVKKLSVKRKRLVTPQGSDSGGYRIIGYILGRHIFKRLLY